MAQSKKNEVRFIRKRGRIIPIRSKKGRSVKRPSRKATRKPDSESPSALNFTARSVVFGGGTFFGAKHLRKSGLKDVLSGSSPARMQIGRAKLKYSKNLFLAGTVLTAVTAGRAFEDVLDKKTKNKLETANIFIEDIVSGGVGLGLAAAGSRAGIVKPSAVLKKLGRIKRKGKF